MVMVVMERVMVVVMVDEEVVVVIFNIYISFMKLGFYIVSILFIGLIGYSFYTNSPFLSDTLSRLGIYRYHDNQ